MSYRLTKHGTYASTMYPSSSTHGQSWGRSSRDAFPTPFYRAKADVKTVFSTNSSTDSLQEYNQQLQRQQREASLEELFNENATLVQKTAIAEHELSASRSDQARLEERVFELDSSLTEARKELQRLSRAKKDCDRELEESNSALEKERTQWADREAELNRSLKFATRPLIVQAPKKGKESSTQRDRCKSGVHACQQHKHCINSRKKQNIVPCIGDFYREREAAPRSGQRID